MYSQNYGHPQALGAPARQEVFSHAAASVYGGAGEAFARARTMEQAHSIAGNNYAHRDARLAASHVDGISQASCARSAMIRHRGQFPKTIWQRGALYSTKKTRKEVSMGRSPEIRKKGKAGGLRFMDTMDQKFPGGPLSDLNQRSLTNFNAQRQQRRTVQLPKAINAHHLLASEEPAPDVGDELDS